MDNTKILLDILEKRNKIDLLKAKIDIRLRRCHPDTDNEVYGYDQEVESPSKNKEELIKLENELLDIL